MIQELQELQLLRECSYDDDPLNKANKETTLISISRNQFIIVVVLMSADLKGYTPATNVLRQTSWHNTCPFIANSTYLSCR